MSSGNSNRFPSIDVLRAAAITLMVIVHFTENLSGRFGRDGGFAVDTDRSWWIPTGFAAATFSFLFGVSYRLWLTAEVRRGRSDDAISKSTVRRGLCLIGLGFSFNVLVWLPEDVFNWDILTLVGCGLLTLEAARRMPRVVVVLAAGLAIAASPTMRLVADYDSFWVSGFYDYDFSLSDVLLGWLVTGYFPLFPWLAYPLLGFALAPVVLSRDRQPLMIGAGLVVASSGFVLGWASLPVAITGGATRGWTMFPASTPYVLGTLGWVMGTLSLLHRLFDTDRGRESILVEWATPLSRHSLTIYLLHHAAHVWPLWLYSYAATGSVTSLWQRAMPSPIAVALAGAFLVVAVVLFHEADRRRIPMAESLVRWLCD